MPYIFVGSIEFLFCIFIFFLDRVLSVALEPVMEVALVEQAGPELTEILPSLPP